MFNLKKYAQNYTSPLEDIEVIKYQDEYLWILDMVSLVDLWGNIQKIDSTFLFLEDMKNHNWYGNESVEINCSDINNKKHLITINSKEEANNIEFVTEEEKEYFFSRY